MYPGNELLTIDEMYEADRLAMAGGVPGMTLMENAGRSIADAIIERWHACDTLILCGPGNNGGDGFVIARLLAEAGWPIRLVLAGQKEQLKGDAAQMAEKWQGPIDSLDDAHLPEAGLVVDALFGAGLDRPLDGAIADLLDTVRESGLPVVAVDVPSGLNGLSGEVLGTVAPATLTVSFFRPKTGHFAADGPLVCGDLLITDIGIPNSVLEDIRPTNFLNSPDMWLDDFPLHDREIHKYEKGHSIVFSGPAHAGGAARLAAKAALRAGTGLVTIAAPDDAVPIHAAHLDAVMVRPSNDMDDVEFMLQDQRIASFVIGPGFGRGNPCRERVRRLVASGRGLVIDADAITSFAGNPDAFRQWMERNANPDQVIMTPHEGEFRRLFRIGEGQRTERALQAARIANSVIILKGPDTVIAHPDGRIAINDHASPVLATAGSGDVLAGIAGGLLAQGMPAFEAACASVWIHGDAGLRLGRGVIAEDVVEILPTVLQDLEEAGENRDFAGKYEDIFKKM